MQTLDYPLTQQDTLRVSALHALAYCPRLFYLEEVEELYTQDAAVFAGRRLHAELEKNDWLRACLGFLPPTPLPSPTFSAGFDGNLPRAIGGYAGYGFCE